MYNPFSLLYAFKKKEFGAYWFDSATPSFLIAALQKNTEQLCELPAQDKIVVRASELTSAYEDNHDPLTYLYQSGHLTIKGYDDRRLEYTLDFPNDEVRYGFLTALIPYVTYKKFTNFRTLKIAELSDDFEAGNSESVMQCLQGILANLPYHEGPDAAIKAETVFRNVVASIFLLTGQLVHTEKHTSQGRIDTLVETPEHVCLFEFKVDKPVEEALEQIERNGYAKPYAGDSRTLHKIGAVFSTKTRTLSDWREVLGSRELPQALPVGRRLPVAPETGVEQTPWLRCQTRCRSCENGSGFAAREALSEAEPAFEALYGFIAENGAGDIPQCLAKAQG